MSAWATVSNDALTPLLRPMLLAWGRPSVTLSPSWPARTLTTRLLFLLSDGRPQDRDYRRPGIDKDYAIHDTRMALLEAQRQRITPFCLTVDTAGHDYMQAMCAGIRYEVLDTLAALPSRLSMLYRSLTS